MIDNERKTYSNKSYDVTIIEIKKDDNIDRKSFFELDQQIFQENAYKIFKNCQIYLLHYPKGIEMEISSGIIKNISEDNKTIHHLCDTSGGSSGSPIINVLNFQVVGIHKGAAEGGKNYNLGTLLKEPIELFNKEIKINKIDNKDNKYYCVQENKGDKSEENEKIKKDNDKKNIEENIINNNYENIDEIIIRYKRDNNEYSNEIKIFGSKFVENNKNICKIIINGNEYELCEKININKNQLKNNIFEIKLKGIKNVTDMSYMFGDGIFFGCESLSSLPDIDKWNTQKVTNMSYMFYDCKSLSSLPDISKWNTQNVTDMRYMFYDCKSLSSLPDISKWDTKNVTNMSYMFCHCESLSFLPDISKWNTQNVTDMNSMFSFCESLSSLKYMGNFIAMFIAIIGEGIGLVISFLK